MANTLKELQDLLSLSQPQQFNMTAPENLQPSPMDISEVSTVRDPAASVVKPQQIPTNPPEMEADPQDQMVEQEISEADAMPAIQEDPVSRRKNLLEELQKARMDQNQNLNLLQAGNMAAQAMASRYGAKIGDGSDVIKSMRDQTNQPIKDYKEGIENEENDPESDVSKFMREQAYATLKKISPDKEYNLENMTANQLKKSMGKLLGQQNQKANTRYVTIQDTDGKVKSQLIDMNTGEVIKELGLAGYAYGSQIDPVSGLLVSTSKSDPNAVSVARPMGTTNKIGAPVASSNTPEATKSVTPYDIKTALNPKEREILDKDVNTFQNEIKEEKRIISEIGAISDASLVEAMKNPNAAKTIGAQIAKIMQGSRLTDADVKLYTGQEGVINVIKDYANEALTGTISPQKAQNIKKTLEVYNMALRKSLENRAKQAAEITKQNFNPELNLPTETMSKLYYIDDKKIQGNESDKVRVKLPNGKVGTIPKANLKKALEQGATEIKD